MSPCPVPRSGLNESSLSPFRPSKSHLADRRGGSEQSYNRHRLGQQTTERFLLGARDVASRGLSASRRLSQTPCSYPWSSRIEACEHPMRFRGCREVRDWPCRYRDAGDSHVGRAIGKSDVEARKSPNQRSPQHAQHFHEHNDADVLNTFGEVFGNGD